METNNETVEEVCVKNLRNILDTLGRRVRIFDDIADDIVAAHKREIAACEARISKQKSINKELVDELATKDAEISDLKDKNTEAFKAVLKRDALVKKLADALERAKYEKKYEYGIRYYVDDGSVLEEERHCDSIDEAKEISDISGYDKLKFVRREVGEWEEVK